MKFERYPKRTIKNYFPTPNEIFTLDLCAGELAVYSYLVRCENKNYQCYPSYRDIGENVKLSKNTVKKYVKSLREKRLIETEPTHIFTHDNRILNGNLKYTIRPIQEAIDYSLEKLFAKSKLETEQTAYSNYISKNKKCQCKLTKSGQL